VIQVIEDQLKTTALLNDNNDFGYQKFNLRVGDHDVFQYLDECGIDGIARDGYVILDKNTLCDDHLDIVVDDHCYVILKSKAKFISCNLLEKHNLAIGYIENVSNSIFSSAHSLANLNQFKNKIIDLQLNWSKEFLSDVYIHLKNRRSENQMLINKEIIQAMLGDVMIHIKSASQHRKQANHLNKSTEEDQSLAITEIKRANHILAKLHGGRSFLSGNVIEMMMIFEYFRNIYFD